MHISSLVALLPLLALTSAAPTCHRKTDVDLASNRAGRWSQDGQSRWGEGQQTTGQTDKGQDTAPAPAPPAPEPQPQTQPVPDTAPAPNMEESKDTLKTEPMPSPVPEPVVDNKDTVSPPAPSPSPSPPPAPKDEPQPAPIDNTQELVAPTPDMTPITPSPSTDAKGKIGLAMDWTFKANVASFDGKVGWYYSWGLNTLPGTEGLEFVPMIHHASVAREFDGNVQAGSTHMLSFNEPDIDARYGGSNMSPAEAAELHKLWTGKVPGSVKIGSPSVARGGQKWMDVSFQLYDPPYMSLTDDQDWLAACGNGCRYDFVPYHYYGTDANDLIKYTKDFYAHFKRPLWLTEFACHDYGTGHICTPAEVESFMKTFFTWADSAEGKGMVERWSWFGAFPNHAPANANGILSPDGSANAMGKLYASF